MSFIRKPSPDSIKTCWAFVVRFCFFFFKWSPLHVHQPRFTLKLNTFPSRKTVRNDVTIDVVLYRHVTESVFRKPFVYDLHRFNDVKHKKIWWTINLLRSVFERRYITVHNSCRFLCMNNVMYKFIFEICFVCFFWNSCLFFKQHYPLKSELYRCGPKKKPLYRVRSRDIT